MRIGQFSESLICSLSFKKQGLLPWSRSRRSFSFRWERKATYWINTNCEVFYDVVTFNLGVGVHQKDQELLGAPITHERVLFPCNLMVHRLWDTIPSLIPLYCPRKRALLYVQSKQIHDRPNTRCCNRDFAAHFFSRFSYHWSSCHKTSLTGFPFFLWNTSFTTIYFPSTFFT